MNSHLLDSLPQMIEKFYSSRLKENLKVKLTKVIEPYNFSN
jgi:hypothetical protein